MSDGGTGLYSYVQNQNSQGRNCNSNPDTELVVTYEPIIRNSVTTYVANYTFVQFFSPSFSLCLGINMILVLDVSGSMRGNKLREVINFTKFVTLDLSDRDSFNIITFNESVRMFSPSLVRSGKLQTLLLIIRTIDSP